MDSETTIPFKASLSRGVLVAGLAWFLAYFAARFALEALAPAPHWDIVVASAPVLAFFWFVWVVQRTLQNIDELRRRVHLEALALAFLTTMLVLMMLGLLDGVPGGRLGLPLRDLWFVLPPLYAICFAVANHRYR
jgi:hypothetical protein